jgi:biopolymer transport protein ExbB
VTETLWESWEYLRQGGWIMIPMGVISLLMWYLIIDRLRVFARLGGRDIEATDALRAIGGNLWEMKGHGLRSELLNCFMAERTGKPDLDRNVLRLHADVLRRSLRKRLALIAVLAAVAPLMGLLGTVLGMIETFEVISVFGTGNAKAMAGGISVALVTTQAGLMIAIPGLFISGWLIRRSQRLQTGLDEFVHALDRNLKNQTRLEMAAS